MRPEPREALVPQCFHIVDLVLSLFLMESRVDCAPTKIWSCCMKLWFCYTWKTFQHSVSTTWSETHIVADAAVVRLQHSPMTLCAIWVVISVINTLIWVTFWQLNKKNIRSHNITLCPFYLEVTQTQLLSARCMTSLTVNNIVLFFTCSHLASTGQVPNGRFDTGKTFKGDHLNIFRNWWAKYHQTGLPVTFRKDVYKILKKRKPSLLNM